MRARSRVNRFVAMPAIPHVVALAALLAASVATGVAQPAGRLVSGETQRWVRRQFDFLEANLDRFPYYRAQRAQYGAAAVLQRELFQKKANLVGNSTDSLTQARDEGHLNVTFHHNWYVNVDQRMPRMRFGNAHVFNLLADSSAGRGIPGLSLAGVAATSDAAVRVENAWFSGVRTPVNTRVGVEPPGRIMVRNSVNFDPVTGATNPFDPQMIVPEANFAWNRPAATTAMGGWPFADASVMPAGYTPARVRLSDYIDSPEFMLGHLDWVGVLVPADAAETELWRGRWQSGTGVLPVE